MCVGAINPDNEDYELIGLEVDTEYRGWLRQRLRESSFFCQLSGGVSGLPDIREAVIPLLRPIEELYYPRNTKSLVPHLVRNLEWYLAPTGRPKLPHGFTFRVGIFLFVVAAGAITISNIFTRGFPWPFLGSGAYPSNLLIVMCCFNFIIYGYWLCRETACVGESASSMKYRINAAELYRYLVELHNCEE
jgi:hypothetical protein